MIAGRDLVDAWLWQNGPERTFLVYALELSRAAS
jgi:hypothetical protein